TVTSLVSTGKIDPNAYESGTLLFTKDFFWYNAAVLVFLAAACRALRVTRVSDRLIRRLTGWLLVLTAIAGLLWILLAKAQPAGEQQYLFDAAKAMIKGKTKDLVRESGSLYFYFATSPAQFGNLAYVELLTRVFGVKGILIAAPALNVLLLVFSYASILKTTGRLFRDNRVTLLALLLLCVSFQPLLLCTVIDAGLLCASLTVWSIGRMVQFIQYGKKANLVWGALLAALAAALGTVGSAAAVALALLLGLHALKQKKWFPAITALAILAVALAAPAGMRLIYQARLETDFGSGLPAVVWKAAERESGASVSREGARAYVGQLRKEYEQDYSAYAEQAKKDLAETADEQSAPAARLLARLSAEWNEPTFASLWSSGAFKPFGERSNYAERIYESSREGKGLNGYFEHPLSLLYLGVLLASAVLLKKRSTEQMILPLIAVVSALALAGYGAKAPETVRLLPILCPFAAYGLLSFGLDLSTHLTRPETSWEEAKSSSRRRNVK
ncbi:MAG TPA: hypothetical protein VN417_01805, partial [Candidatus Cryosericum sp.]|nr:hypothetical protein [Candidatus Cryosericum sp.]